MSKNSPRQTHLAFADWLKWAQTSFKSMKKKKRPNQEFPTPDFKFDQP